MNGKIKCCDFIENKTEEIYTFCLQQLLLLLLYVHNVIIITHCVPVGKVKRQKKKSQ